MLLLRFASWFPRQASTPKCTARIPGILPAVALVFLTLFGSSVSAQNPARQRPPNPAYLADLPTVERIQSDVKGSDANDTTARQAGVLWQIYQLISDVALSQHRTDRQWTPDERRLTEVYRKAYYTLWNPLEQSLAQDKPALNKLRIYTDDKDFLDQVLAQLGATTVLAEYAKANAAFAATHQALVARRKSEQSMAQAAQASDLKRFQEDMANKAKFEQEKRVLARCVASGRGDSACLKTAMGKDLEEMYPVLKTMPLPTGLSMAGQFADSSGFGLDFYREGVTVRCGSVAALGGYSVESKNGHVSITLREAPPGAGTLFTNNEALAKLTDRQKPNADTTEFQSQRVVLIVRPDGSLAGQRMTPQPANTILVTGPVLVGSSSGTRRVMRDGELQDERYTENKYEIRTETCRLGSLAVKGSSPVLGSVDTATTAQFDLLFGGSDSTPGKMAPPGLRIEGDFRGTEGLDIEFHPENAVVSCGEAILASEYTVSPSGTGAIVRIANGGAPISLTLSPDGTLKSSSANPARATVSGKVISGTDANGDLAYQPRTATCTLSTLTPNSH